MSLLWSRDARAIGVGDYVELSDGTVRTVVLINRLSGELALGTPSSSSAVANLGSDSQENA